MKTVAPNEKPQDLISKGFDLDRRINYALIAAGLGVAAVGSVVAAPAVAVFGATVAGGSLAGIAVTDRLRNGYEDMRNKRAAKKLGKKVTKDNFTLAA